MPCHTTEVVSENQCKQCVRVEARCSGVPIVSNGFVESQVVSNMKPAYQKLPQQKWLYQK